MRLPSRFHIKHARDFAAIRAKGRSRAGKYVVLSSLSQTEVEEFQFGLITTRKVGGAVVRNKLRRQLREIIRELRPSIRNGQLLVTIARWNCAQASFAEIRQDWLLCARRLGVLCKPEPSEQGAGS
jgi:ribonuclease P protein component